MHVYLYDEYVNHKKYNHLLIQLEKRITDFGLNGRIIRLNITKNVYNAVQNELKNGVKTIVVLGNNHIINQTINAIIRFKTTNNLNFDTVLGVIPIGEENNSIATALGIKNTEQACEILSARRIEKIKIAQAGNNFFLSNAKIGTQNTTIKINENYSIEVMDGGEINVINLLTANNNINNIKSDPKDDILELCIKTKFGKNFLNLNKKGSESFFSLKELAIINNNEPLILDESVEIKTPVELKISNQILNIIVGKERLF